MGLLEIASATMRNGERRVEIAAQNAVNTETPGYKAQVAFNEISTDSATSDLQVEPPRTQVQHRTNQGAIFDTGEALDFAVDGTGFFLVREGEGFSLTRSGKFGIDAQGALVDAQGRVLQLASGGDALTSTYGLEVLADGTMLDGSAVIGTIGLFEPGPSFTNQSLSADDLSTLDEAQDSEIRQAMLERSNVTLSDEMVELMQAQRQVESGAQLIRAYDTLLDRAINTFGRNS